VFTTYAPAGITEGQVTRHLEGMRDSLRLIAPEAQLETLKIFSAAVPA
jgi:hypothetical protein